VKYLTLGYINKKLVEPRRFKQNSFRQNHLSHLDNHNIPWRSHDFVSLSFSKANNTLEELNIIFELLKFNKSVKSLKIRGIKLTDKEISILLLKIGSKCNKCCNNMKRDIANNCKECNSTIQKLDVMYNQITDEGCENIRDYLMKNLSLRSLSIGHNPKISLVGLKIVSFGLLVNHNLVHLNLQGLNIEEEKCKVINTILTFNRSIEKLDLSYNLINKNCILDLETGLTKNKILKELYLCGNPLSNCGLIELVKFIRLNSSLVYLDLKSTNLDKSSLKILKEVKNILNIDLLGNY
jgi:hypothetical protein